MRRLAKKSKCVNCFADGGEYNIEEIKKEIINHCGGQVTEECIQEIMTGNDEELKQKVMYLSQHLQQQEQASQMAYGGQKPYVSNDPMEHGGFNSTGIAHRETTYSGDQNPNRVMIGGLPNTRFFAEGGQVDEATIQQYVQEIVQHCGGQVTEQCIQEILNGNDEALKQKLMIVSQYLEQRSQSQGNQQPAQAQPSEQQPVPQMDHGGPVIMDFCGGQITEECLQKAIKYGSPEVKQAAIAELEGLKKEAQLTAAIGAEVDRMFAKGGWIQKATERMKRKGTVGSFTKYCGGKVTEECIQRGLRSKDPVIRKKAQFAKNMRAIAKRAMGGEFTMDYEAIAEFFKNSV